MKHVLFAVAFAAATIACPVAIAQNFPNKPVKILVPFSPGTAADITARLLGSRLAELWGQGGPDTEIKVRAGNSCDAATPSLPSP